MPPQARAGAAARIERRRSIRLPVRLALTVCGDAGRFHEETRAYSEWLLLRRTKRLRPDIVVGDYRMPEMDGVQAAYAIRQFAPKNQHHFLIVSTTLPKMSAAARVMGANAFVSKSTGEITLAVRHLMRRENVIGVKSIPD